MHEPLEAFCLLMVDDLRIMPSHISMYVALWQAWKRNGCRDPVCIDKEALKRVAKISAKQTYNGVLRSLHAYGYIKYEPSADPRVKSRVWLTANHP